MLRVLPACALLMVSAACGVSFERQAYIEHDEKRFPADQKVELRLETFDGAIEIRGWDRPEVVVEIEKRGRDKDAVSKIVITAEQKDNRIEVLAKHPSGTATFMFGSYASPSAKFVVSVPRKIDLLVHTGDGSLRIERVDGKISMQSGDGSVKAFETAGELFAETGDGSIEVEDIAGRAEVRTGDGSIRVTGSPAVVRARSGDGSIVLRITGTVTMADDWSIETGDGSISATLPEGFSAEIEADPGGDGRARSELPLVNATGGTRDRQVLRGRLGAGGHRLTLRTGDGTIHLTSR